MSQRNITYVVAVLLLAALTVWIAASNLQYDIPQEPVEGIGESAPPWASILFWQGEQQRSVRPHYGLDLVGGSQVVLEAEQPASGEKVDYSDVMEAARVVIENRVSGGLGVVEPLVQLQGNNRIIVELPEVDDPDQAIALVKETGSLEFVEALRTPLQEGDRILTSDAVALAGDEEIDTTGYAYSDQVFDTVMTGAHLADARVDIDNQGRRYIGFTLTKEGSDIFGDYTGAHVGDFLAITLDGVVVSAPRIQTQITGRDGQITGGGTTGFLPDEADSLAIKLKYGALPVPLSVVENRTVGPSLGHESLQKSLRAGMIGLIVVLVFMIIYYRVPGAVAALALILYGLINFSLYKLIPVTLTVPAITGFILSIGMAVDANILVFERMKEELRNGRSIRRAIESGFTRAWPSIRDANLSTLITCIILFWFGSNFGASIVKGFAFTLGLGVVVNLFTAYTITRILMRFTVGLVGDSLINNSKMWLGLNLEAKGKELPGWARGAFHLVEKRKWFYLFSTVIIVAGLVIMGVSAAQYGSPLKLSIDYTGGSLWEMSFEQPTSPSDVRAVFVDAGFTNTSAQSVAGNNVVLIRTKDLTIEEKEALAEAITAEFDPFDERRFEAIGPTIGREVTKASTTAVTAASVAILLFIWYAFRTIPHAIRYGFSAIVAMLHDILVTAGFFALAGLILGWEIDTLFLTAILTVIGYSVNDSIVVFDRLRENLPRYRSESYHIVANRSLLETLNRSLITTISTLFVVGAVLAFGGATTQKFMAVMFVGIASGAYSSIFIAVPLLVSWQKKDIGKAIKRPKGVQAAG